MKLLEPVPATLEEEKRETWLVILRTRLSQVTEAIEKHEMPDEQRELLVGHKEEIELHIQSVKDTPTEEEAQEWQKEQDKIRKDREREQGWRH